MTGVLAPSGSQTRVSLPHPSPSGSQTPASGSENVPTPDPPAPRVSTVCLSPCIPLERERHLVCINIDYVAHRALIVTSCRRHSRTAATESSTGSSSGQAPSRASKSATGWTPSVQFSILPYSPQRTRVRTIRASDRRVHSHGSAVSDSEGIALRTEA